jgi:hypothetical protein
MKMTLLLLVGILFTGCAKFRTVQFDNRYNEDGSLRGEIVTKATAYTLFSSRQLANWKASQTEKSQGASVGVEQQGATNSVAVLNAIAEILKATGGLVP